MTDSQTTPGNSFVAGLSITQHSEDAATFLQMSRDDGYDFCTTALPYSSTKVTSIRRDVTTLDSKWWSTSIVGMVTDPPELVAAMQDRNEDTYMSNAGAPVETSSSSVLDGGTKNSNGSVSVSAGHGKYLVQALISSDWKKKTIMHNNAQVSLAKFAQQCLSFMLEWAGHMSIPAVLLPAIPPGKAVDCLPYAQLLSTLAPIAAAQNVQLWITTPLSPPALERFQMLHTLCDAPSNLGCMLIFDSSSNSANNATSSPAAATNAAAVVGQSVSLIHASVGCALRAVAFDTTAFLTNKRGYPTLSKSHQVLFTELLRRLGRTLRILVQGVPYHHSPQTEAGGQSGCLSYLQYLRHLRSRGDVVDVLDTTASQLESAYLDHLQSPLQPLGDNLEFQTYETFETDPIKYTRYKHAIELALRDKVSLNQLKKPSLDNSQSNGSLAPFGVTILVVGAGRGPLVRAALQAVHAVNQAGVSVMPTIVAVEKNPSAVLYLHSVKAREAAWVNTVTITECDMRFAAEHLVLKTMIQDPDKRADICVSELLGSFGDNELSPECLDGVQKSGLLKETCVCIPQRYTSYLAPVSSMRLHCEAQVKAFDAATPTEGPSGKPTGSRQALETPYVVRTHAASQTHIELPCWEFSHFQNSSDKQQPIKDSVAPDSNERFAQLLFAPDPTHGAGCGCGYGHYDGAISGMAASGMLTSDTVIHGFLGSFHCVLYQSPLADKESSVISIAPQSFSMGMFSWFPLYFPLRQPLYVPHGASIICNMWRKTNVNENHTGSGGRVWYEWCAQVVAPSGSDSNAESKVLNVTPIHNPNGRSYFVRL